VGVFLHGHVQGIVWSQDAPGGHETLQVRRGQRLNHFGVARQPAENERGYPFCLGLVCEVFLNPPTTLIKG
jgi:hypothetical protein